MLDALSTIVCIRPGALDILLDALSTIVCIRPGVLDILEASKSAVISCELFYLYLSLVLDICVYIITA